jgi:hypothetical protein
MQHFTLGLGSLPLWQWAAAAVVVGAALLGVRRLARQRR